MGKMQVRQEARALQGKNVQCNERSLHIAGGSSQAEFEMGSEGLVHLAIDEMTGEKFRIKCFWEPGDRRRQRSEKLVGLGLPDLNKAKADALGGAPFGMLPALGPCTPFALVMKNVRGENWKKLRARCETESQCPPSWWPPAKIRATWGYGLATAVMKMETRGFIHADLSPGNVVVNDGFHGVLDTENSSREGFPPPSLESHWNFLSRLWPRLFTLLRAGNSRSSKGNGSGEDESGDMALVDFDRYVHLPGDLPEPGQGSQGYASPEIWQKQVPTVGSDRTAMAILIQEFLVSGDPDLTRAESFDWSYDQQDRCFNWTFNAERKGSPDRGDVHPLLDRKYPALAKLVHETLTASVPDSRPSPDVWRRTLKEIVEGPVVEIRNRFPGMSIEADPIRSSALRLAFSPSKDFLDLSTTGFGIRASIERDPGGAIFLLIHPGAVLNVRPPGSKKWTQYSGGTRVAAEIGMVLFDKNGKSNARLGDPK